MLAETGQQSGAFSSEPLALPLADLRPALLDAVQRALRRLCASQHQDGGWGPYVETSEFWHTASVVLCLGAARRHLDMSGVVNDVVMLLRACSYLEHHPEDWSADALFSGENRVTGPRAAGSTEPNRLPAPPTGLNSPQSSLSIYNLGLMARVFFHGGRSFLRHETGVRVYRSLEHLVDAQNDDGGWDACLWGYAVETPTRIFSEVGATSAALRALAIVDDERLAPAVHRAGHWLLNTQNVDGSWNNGACRPDLPAFTLSGDPRVNKTCDALMGLLAGSRNSLSNDLYVDSVRRGLVWLLRRTRPALEKHLRPSAWGWGYTADDYENITLVLEVLLALPNPPQPLVAAYAGWLLRGQHRMPGDIQDGSWVLGHTARIALALVQVLS